MIGQNQGNAGTQEVLYGKPVPPPPDSTHDDGTVVPFVRASWNEPVAPLTMERVLWLLEWHGWTRSAALDCLASAWVKDGIDGYGAYHGTSPLLHALFSISPDAETAAGATFETKAPYGPASAMTPAGVVEVVSKVTTNGTALAIFDGAKANAARYRSGRTFATTAAGRYDDARAREKAGWTPWDSESGGVISQPIPVLDQVGDILGGAWDAATAVPRFLAKLASIIFSGSFWLRIGIGLAGLAMIGAALYLANPDAIRSAATAAAA